MTRSLLMRRPPPKRKTIKRRSKNDTGPKFLIGLDLGQARDYTAMIIIERILPTQAGGDIEYHLRHLERYDLGTPYPDIVNDISELLDGEPLADQSSLIVDGTGVGVPVVEMFQAAGLNPVPIWITSGDSVTRKGKIVRVPKRNLVSVLQVLFQTNRLKIADTIAMRDVLINELMNFKVKITTSANDTYGAWREGTHDDLVLALSMACWVGEQLSRTPQTEMHIQNVNRHQTERSAIT